MDNQSLIIITGASGFIGSCLVSFLNTNGFENLILVDDFRDEKKANNLEKKRFLHKVERENLFDWLQIQKPPVKFFYHIGARTDTTEFDYAVHEHLNVDYSKKVWDYCSVNNIPLVYASSAATYGAGEYGYNDDHEIIKKLQPLNPYGVSKNEVDKWAIGQALSKRQPPFWAALKFFNVYGPNEYHKARMASVIYHSYLQIQQSGKMKLFKSYKEDYKDGEQLRDFIYVKDVIKICYWFMESFRPAGRLIESGIYNVGTGMARSFDDLVKATFAALQIPAQIDYIEMPEDIKEKYQYYTQANIQKIRDSGYEMPFFSLEEGVSDYVKNYLVPHKYY